MNSSNIKRILVALDSSEVDRNILQTATSLASQLNAELNALFVEDINLLSLAELPIAREVVYGAESGRQINFADMERAIRMQASRLRKMVESMAQQQQIKINFDVMRGDIAGELCSAAQQADLLIVGKSTQLVKHGQKIGRVTKTVLSSVSCNLLVLQHGAILEQPMAVLFTGTESSKKALQLAIELARQNHDNPAVILPSCNPEALEKLKKHISLVKQETGIDMIIYYLKESTAESLLESLVKSGANLILLGMHNDYFDNMQLQTFLEENSRATILTN